MAEQNGRAAEDYLRQALEDDVDPREMVARLKELDPGAFQPPDPEDERAKEAEAKIRQLDPAALLKLLAVSDRRGWRNRLDETLTAMARLRGEVPENVTQLGEGLERLRRQLVEAEGDPETGRGSDLWQSGPERKERE